MYNISDKLRVSLEISFFFENLTFNPDILTDTNMTEQMGTVGMENDGDKISIAKELFNSGSRNYMVKNYDVAADELSQVCSIYEELNGPLSDELGMPYLLYAKCLIILAVDENKVLDVPNEEVSEGSEEEEESVDVKNEKNISNDNNLEKLSEIDNKNKFDDTQKKLASTATDCIPGTSTDKDLEEKDEIEETDAASNLQIAWEILELAAKIFSKQGMGALPNLAEVHTELGNIEFENNVLEDARSDYEKSLCIYKELPIKEYRRAIAEVNYKIGLTYLLQDVAPEGISSFKTACEILNDEIEEIKSKENLSQKDKDNIQDMEETQQEILDKITEIEETRKQSMDKVRAALHSFISPVENLPEKPTSADNISEKVTKPTDISHLIKRKKPTETSSPPEESSPAKRPAL